jgi:hypothetical protein
MIRTARLLTTALVGLVSGESPQQPELTFASAPCHVAFRHPADWVVRPDTNQAADPCAFLIRPLAWDSLLVDADSVDLYTLGLRVVAQDFEAAVAESPFERRNGTWVILGRQGLENAATPIADRGWQGVWGTATIGCYRIEGGYAGLCDAPTALVGTATRSAMLEGGPQSENVFDRILATLELRP